MSDIFSLILDASWLVQLVMLILVIMSVYSWTIVLAKKTKFIVAKKDIDTFDEKLSSQENLTQVYNNLSQLDNTRTVGEDIFYKGYHEFHHNSDTDTNLQVKQLSAERAFRTMHTVANQNLDNLSKDLSILAMISNSAPYIGLFGTVWGIMQSFLGLASVKQATIAIVAPGIAEALIATAFGLFAAIPAGIFYNRMANDINIISQQYNHLIEDIFVKFQR